MSTPEMSPSRRDGRRRRANVAGGRPRRHEVKVSAEEEGILLRLAEAQRITIPRLLVESTLAAASGQTITERRELIAELFAIHRLLGAVSNNLNQLTRKTHALGEWQPETRATLERVREISARLDEAVDRLSLS